MTGARELPIGRVTFVFTDIEGSTRLLHELGAASFERALVEHRRLVRDAFDRLGGVEVDTQGDAFFYAFANPQSAVDAACAAQDALESGRVRIRIGIHTGTAEISNGGYIGSDVHKGARIAAAAHGGQIAASNETRDLVDADWTDLGEHRLKDFDEPVWIFQIGDASFPPIKTISNTNLPRPASTSSGANAQSPMSSPYSAKAFAS